MSADRPARGMIVSDHPAAGEGPMACPVPDGRVAHSLYLTMLGVCDEPVDEDAATALERGVVELLAWSEREPPLAHWRRSTAFKVLVRLPPRTPAQSLAPATIAAVEALERLMRSNQP